MIPPTPGSRLSFVDSDLSAAEQTSTTNSATPSSFQYHSVISETRTDAGVAVGQSKGTTDMPVPRETGQ